MIVYYYEIAVGHTETSCYSPFSFDTALLRLGQRKRDAEITRYTLNEDTGFVRVAVWECALNDWMEVGGAPFLKMGADLRERIRFAQSTARANDYWL